MNVTIILRNILYKTLASCDSKDIGAFILCYHSISNNEWRHSVDKESFIEQIEHLCNRYKPINMSDIFTIIKGDNYLGKIPSFVINFDDGYKDILTVKNYLKGKNIKPVVYLISESYQRDNGQLDNSLPTLSDEEVKSLIEDGWEIGSHGATHKDFWKLSKEEIQHEVFESKKQLESKYGIHVKYFSYPRGRYTDEIVEAVKNAGYEMAVTMDDDNITSNTNPLLIPRIGIDKSHRFNQFRVTMCESVVKARKFIKNFAGGIARNYL